MTDQANSLQLGEKQTRGWGSPPAFHLNVVLIVETVVFTMILTNDSLIVHNIATSKHVFLLSIREIFLNELIILCVHSTRTAETSR